MWLVPGYPSAAVPNPDVSPGENFLQLLTIETVFVHHFVDELLGIRVIGEVTAHLHHIVLRLKQEAARRRSGGRFSLSRFWLAATGGKQHKKGEAMLHNDA